MVRQGLLTRAVLGMAACGLTALAYLPAVDYPFVLDDRTTVLLNPSLVDPFDVRGILFYDRWHALINVSFAIDRALSGISPLGFHITNGVIHIIVVALLFVFASRLRSGASADPAPGPVWAAFLVAAAFAMNPLTARSVLYVSARPDLVCAAGTLLVLMLARRARERGGAAAIAAVAVALVTLTATPWGFGATHGPPRFYMTTGVVLFLAGWFARPLLARSRAARVAGVIAIAALVFATRHVLPRWEDPVGLWSAEIARTPDAWDAHLGAADALREAAHCPEASAEYRVALRLKPDLDAARSGLARCRE